jgi:hypothetical protein
MLLTEAPMDVVTRWMPKLLIMTGTVLAFIGGCTGSTNLYESQRGAPNGWPLVIAGGVILVAGVVLEIAGRRGGDSNVPKSPTSAQ